MNDIYLTSIESRPSEFLHSSPPKNQSSAPAAMRSAWQGLYLLLDTSRASLATRHRRPGRSRNRRGRLAPSRTDVATARSVSTAELGRVIAGPRCHDDDDLTKCKLRRECIAANLAYHAHHTLHT